MKVSQLLYGLKVEFVKQYGLDMAISAEGGLKREELSEFQLRMLTANRIPRLLELRLEARDGNCTLYYQVSGKRMLAQILRMDPITMEQYYLLLLQVVEVLADSAMNMLQPGRFVLQEDFIFVGEGLDQLYFTYLPKEQLEGKNSVSADLQHLASRWIHRVSELRGSGFQELMRFLQEESFNLPELKQLVNRQLERLASASSSGDQRPMAAVNMKGEAGEGHWNAGFVPPVRPAGRAPQGSSVPSGHWPPHESPVSRSTSEEFALRSWELSPDPPQPSHNLDTGGPGGQVAGIGSGAGPSEASASSKSAKGLDFRSRRLPVVLAMILALGLLWKQYADQPEEQWLYLCAGGSVVIVGIGMGLLQRIVRRRQLLEQEQQQSFRESDFASELSQSFPGHGPEMNKPLYSYHGELGQELSGTGGRPSDHPFPTSGPLADSVSFLESAGLMASAAESLQSTNQTSLYGESADVSGGVERRGQGRGLDGRTTLLRRPDATVVLSRTHTEAALRDAYLETYREGKTEKIPLNKASILIGRQGTEVDWVMEEAGVSRMHAELVREQGGVMVKDLGSSNGTRVNGELLIPYQTHLLNNGDVISIVTTEFTYRTRD
ncbi:DUF6382 domain-containing protein [Paenibacillus filicis]|uniref:DUF6382 domain-containing protein n=1 Tax=Paenibacillus filicis TaxID=669464 RepID=A0ABU9DI95_9BACL